MIKHIFGQALFQLIVIITLTFCGENFIPEYEDSYDTTIFATNPAGKWHNGIVGGTVRSGRFFTPTGGVDYFDIFTANNKLYSRHFTFIFNAFIMIQIFQFFNARKIHEEVSILIFSSIFSREFSATLSSL